MKQMAESPGVAHRSQSKTIHFRYDEYCDLLGGATWKHALKHWLETGLSSERHEMLIPLGSYFSSDDQFFFSDHRMRDVPLEILWLKWNLFSALCRKVFLFHKERQRPLLGINTSTVKLMIPSPISSSLPARWTFHLDFDEGIESTHFADVSVPPDLKRQLFNPPEKIATVFEAPVLRSQPLGYEVTGTAMVRSIERVRETRDDRVRGVIELHFLFDDYRASEFSKNDVFLINLSCNDKFSFPVQIWASNMAPLEKGLLLKGLSEPLEPPAWATLEKAHRNVFSQSRMTVFKSYHAPSDLYSLGMMLFTTFLVNQSQDIKAVHQAVRQIAEGLEHMVRGLDSDDHRILTGRFQDCFNQYGLLFSRQSIFYDTDNINPLEKQIPFDLWNDFLILGFRLISCIPGFSFCRNHGDVNVEQPQLLMETVRAPVERLADRIKVSLFRSEQRDREVREVCSLLRQELAVEKIGRV